MEDKVILVDENNNPLGLMDKLEAHQKGVLHRAFSIFIFDDANKMLLQQRAFSKYHSAGLWTNACCSHQKQNQTTLQAAHIRLQEELGFDVPLQETFSFLYKASFDNNLIEHELDFVLLGNIGNQKIKPNPAEVCDTIFLSVNEIEIDIQANPNKYTAWFIIALPQLKHWILNKK
jgi:isopentenyl-diphosphate Delta-isomerase